MIQAAKIIGTGLATTGLIGAGVGIGAGIADTLDLAAAINLANAKFPEHLYTGPGYSENIQEASKSLEFLVRDLKSVELALKYVDFKSNNLEEVFELRSAFIQRQLRYMHQVFAFNYKGISADYSVRSNVVSMLRYDYLEYKYRLEYFKIKSLCLDPQHNFLPLALRKDLAHPILYSPFPVEFLFKKRLKDFYLLHPEFENSDQIRHQELLQWLNNCNSDQLELYIRGRKSEIEN